MQTIDWIVLGLVIVLVLLLAFTQLSLLWECTQLRFENKQLKSQCKNRLVKKRSLVFHEVDLDKDKLELLNPKESKISV